MSAPSLDTDLAERWLAQVREQFTARRRGWERWGFTAGAFALGLLLLYNHSPLLFALFRPSGIVFLRLCAIAIGFAVLLLPILLLMHDTRMTATALAHRREEEKPGEESHRYISALVANSIGLALTTAVLIAIFILQSIIGYYTKQWFIVPRFVLDMLIVLLSIWLLARAWGRLLPATAAAIEGPPAPWALWRRRSPTLRRFCGLLFRLILPRAAFWILGFMIIDDLLGRYLVPAGEAFDHWLKVVLDYGTGIESMTIGNFLLNYNRFAAAPFHPLVAGAIVALFANLPLLAIGKAVAHAELSAGNEDEVINPPQPLFTTAMKFRAIVVVIMLLLLEMVIRAFGSSDEMLNKAAKYGDLNLAKAAVMLRAEMRYPYRRSNNSAIFSPLHQAIELDRQPIVEFLVAQGAFAFERPPWENVTDNPLYQAVMEENLPAMKTLLAYPKRPWFDAATYDLLIEQCKDRRSYEPALYNEMISVLQAHKEKDAGKAGTIPLSFTP